MTRTIKALASALALVLTVATSASTIVISEIDPWVQYTSAASQTTFSYPFPILLKTELAIFDQGNLVAATDYSVTNLGVVTGGNVVFTVGRDSGDIITIQRDTARARISQYDPGGDFSRAVLDADLNALVKMVQDSDNDALRALTQTAADWDGNPVVLPKAVEGENLGWAAGKIVNLKPCVNNTDCTATFNTLIPDDNRTVTTMEQYLENNKVFNVLDYGAVCDNVNDDTEALQATFDAATLAGGGLVVIPATGNDCRTWWHLETGDNNVVIFFGSFITQFATRPQDAPDGACCAPGTTTDYNAASGWRGGILATREAGQRTTEVAIINPLIDCNYVAQNGIGGGSSNDADTAGIGPGAHNTTIFGGTIRNCVLGLSEGGGKCVTAQQGAGRFRVVGTYCENCATGIGIGYEARNVNGLGLCDIDGFECTTNANCASTMADLTADLCRIPSSDTGTTAANPFATVNLSTTVTVTDTAHDLVTGNTAVFTDATATNGIPAAELNRVSGFYVDKVDADSFTIVTDTAATSTGSGGGTVTWVALESSTRYVNNVTFEGMVMRNVGCAVEVLQFPDPVAGDGPESINYTVSGLDCHNCGDRSELVTGTFANAALNPDANAANALPSDAGVFCFMNGGAGVIDGANIHNEPYYPAVNLFRGRGHDGTFTDIKFEGALIAAFSGEEIEHNSFQGLFNHSRKWQGNKYSDIDLDPTSIVNILDTAGVLECQSTCTDYGDTCAVNADCNGCDGGLGCGAQPAGTTGRNNDNQFINVTTSRSPSAGIVDVDSQSGGGTGSVWLDVTLTGSTVGFVKRQGLANLFDDHLDNGFYECETGCTNAGDPCHNDSECLGACASGDDGLEDFDNCQLDQGTCVSELCMATNAWQFNRLRLTGSNTQELATTNTTADLILDRDRSDGLDEFAILAARFYLRQQVEIETGSSDALAALLLDQNDVDEPFIHFEGTSNTDATNSLSTGTTAGASLGWVQIKVNGTKEWFERFADPAP